MDYEKDCGHSWDWQGNDNNNLKQSKFYDLSDMVTEVTLNQEDQSYMFDDESTPVKACVDFSYYIGHDNTNKEPEERREKGSILKRRRMLQFDNQLEDFSIFSGENPSTILNSNVRENLFTDILPEGSHLISGFSEDASASGFEGLNLSSEEWLSECFNDVEMQFIPENMNFTNASELPIDVSEFLNVSPETEANVVPQYITQTATNVIFKGRKSFIHTPSKLPSSVVYPFAFVKPCGVHGDITLEDINLKIQTPPPLKAKQSREEPPVYQTSAFSGKPVVGKTKIRTEGGKGSITIMRTRG